MHKEKVALKKEGHIVPILYHLENDPVHMRLLEVCRQDVEILRGEVLDLLPPDQ